MRKVIFVNLPVADLAASRRFFAALGFGFDERFCDRNTLCVQLGVGVYAMMLRTEFFAAFTDRQVADGHRTTEAILCLGADSRQAVDVLVDAAIAAGGSEPRPPQQCGEQMYGRTYADLDGHLWEIIWSDPGG
jgi:predicted lactoylglutathione lyase